MKIILIIMFIFSGFAAFAELEPQVRGDVDTNLSAARGYVRVANNPIEIVRDGNILPPAKFVHPNTWNPDLSLQKLKTLTVQHVHLNSNNIKTESADSFLVPFVSEIRFQQRHDSVTLLGANVGEAVQGTIRIAGHLRTRVLNIAIAAVEPKVELYTLSNPTESVAANVTEHINRYDSRFINDVAVSIITELFKQPEHRDTLMKVISSRK